MCRMGITWVQHAPIPKTYDLNFSKKVIKKKRTKKYKFLGSFYVGVMLRYVLLEMNFCTFKIINNLKRI